MWGKFYAGDGTVLYFNCVGGYTTTYSAEALTTVDYKEWILPHVNYTSIKFFQNHG